MGVSVKYRGRVLGFRFVGSRCRRLKRLGRWWVFGIWRSWE